MLQQIREFASVPIVRWTFVGFLVVVFGVFGLETYLQPPAGGDSVATVGNQRIGQSEFDGAVRRQAEQYKQQFGANFDAAIMDNPEMRRSVLDRIVAERLVAIGARDAGVRVGDKALADRIASEPAFHDPNGKFSKERYEQIARSMSLTTVGLDERLREDFRLEAFRNAISETAFVPRATLDGFIRLQEQSREVSVVNITPEAHFAKVKITPEQVKAYYEGRATEFTIPAQVRAEYVELSAEALAAQAQAAPEDVKRIYEESLKGGRWGQPEQRRASHILIAVKPDAKEAEKKASEDKARALVAELRRKPAGFADAAKKESADTGSAVQGGDLGEFARNGTMVKPFEDAVFGAKKGEIVGPVATEYGFHVILVTDVKAEKVKSLAEATPEIEADLKKSQASRRFVELAETFTNVVYEQPSSLKPASDLLKLPVQQSGWFGAQFGAPPALANPKIQAELLADDAVKGKRNTTAVEVRPNVLVAARVLEHKPAELRPLATVQADIERRLQREEAVKLAQAEGEAKLAELKAGKDAGLTWPAPLAVNRQKPGGILPQVMDPVFRAEAKGLPAYLGVSTPMGYSLVKLTKVIELEKVDEAKREGLGTQLRAAVAAANLEATLASIRNRAGVSVKKDLIEKKADEAAPAQGTQTPPRPSAPKKF